MDGTEQCRHRLRGSNLDVRKLFGRNDAAKLLQISVTVLKILPGREQCCPLISENSAFIARKPLQQTPNLKIHHVAGHNLIYRTHFEQRNENLLYSKD
jgi:hypothetical protein